MMIEASMARALMWVTGLLTPASRSEWRAAMAREFEAMDGGAGSLGWAAGCLCAATGWRLRAEAAFLSALAGAFAATSILIGLLFFAVVEAFRTSDMSWMLAFTIGQHAVLGLACLTLALIWPRRAPLIGVMVPLTAASGAMGGFLLQIVFRDGSIVPTLSAVGDGLMFLGMEMWSSLLGAALGAAVVVLRRGRSAG